MAAGPTATEVYEYVGECYLNRVIGAIIRRPLQGGDVGVVLRAPRHCQGAADCAGMIKRHAEAAPSRDPRGRGSAGVVYAVDLEEDESLRGLIEATLNRLGCTEACRNEALGVILRHCVARSGRRIIVVLFDGGPERVAERAGVRLGDADARRRLKSRWLIDAARSGCSERIAVCRVVRALADVVAGCLARALQPGLA